MDDDHLQEAMKLKNETRKMFIFDTQNVALQDQYKREKQIKTLIDESKNQYYGNNLNENKSNVAKTWKTIRDIIPNSKHKVSNCNFDNEITKANEFNKHFADVGRNTYEKTQETLDGENVIHFNDMTNTLDDDNNFRPQPVDTDTIILTIKGLKDTSSVGCDGIPLTFIKDSLFAIAFYLTCIVNTSIVTGIFPSTWKHDLVVPLFKSGDTKDFNNYRPISLLLILSKILEKVVAGQLSHYLEINKLLSNTQHGFRPRLSTETALTVITDKIYDNMDSKKTSALTLCYLS